MKNVYAPTKNLQMLNKTPVPPAELNMSIEEENKENIPENIAENYPEEKYLSVEEVLEKQKQTKEIDEKMKQLEEEKEKIENEINKESKIKDLYDYFKNPRTEFVFKITYDDGNFRESSIKNYLSALVKGISNQNNKILKWKVFEPFVWLKVEHPIIIRWVKKRTDSKGDLTNFTMFQFREDKLFEYI